MGGLIELLVWIVVISIIFGFAIGGIAAMIEDSSYPWMCGDRLEIIYRGPGVRRCTEYVYVELDTGLVYLDNGSSMPIGIVREIRNETHMCNRRAIKKGACGLAIYR